MVDYEDELFDYYYKDHNERFGSNRFPNPQMWNTMITKFQLGSLVYRDHGCECGNKKGFTPNDPYIVFSKGRKRNGRRVVIIQNAYSNKRINLDSHFFTGWTRYVL